MPGSSRAPAPCSMLLGVGREHLAKPPGCFFNPPTSFQPRPARREAIFPAGFLTACSSRDVWGKRSSGMGCSALPKGFISFDFIWGLREGQRHAELGEATARVTPGWVLPEGCNRNPQSSVGSRISPVRLCWLLQLSPSFIHPFLLPKSPLPSPAACTSPFCPARIPFPSMVGKGNKGWQRN